MIEGRDGASGMDGRALHQRFVRRLPAASLAIRGQRVAGRLQRTPGSTSLSLEYPSSADSAATRQHLKIVTSAWGVKSQAKWSIR